MLNDMMLVELAVWVVAVLIAKKAESGVLSRACELALVFILSGHSWKITVSVGVLVFLLRKIWEWVIEFSLEALFPELRKFIQAFLREKSGLKTY